MCARAGGAFGGQDLGQHAAFGDVAAGLAAHLLQLRRAGLGYAHQLGRWVLARIARIQTGLVGEDDQAIGLDQVGHQRPQRVVVAELDLVGDHGVVLVDDRYHAQREQGAQGRSRI